MKKAFVTGASGFLGTNLVKALIKEGWEVVVFALPNDKLKYISGDHVSCVRGNILDKNDIRLAMPEGKITVFHVAGMTSMWYKYNKKQYQINVEGTKNVCDVAIEKNVDRLVYTSSISAYGYHKVTVNEETSSNALRCKMNYNKTKYLGEEEVRKAILQGLNAVIVNPCNIIGPYDTVGWATMIVSVKRGNTNGATGGIGTFAHVKDVAKAHIKAAENGKCGENYLLGGVEVSFKEVICRICKMTKIEEPKRCISPFILRVVMIYQWIKSLFDGKQPLLTYSRYKRLTGNIICDDSKARKELDYNTCSLDEMLLDSYNWLLKEGVLS